jgi:hypothetical protein
VRLNPARYFTFCAALLALALPAFAGITVVTPEPGTWLTMAAGVGGLLLLHRMRSKSKPK